MATLLDPSNCSSAIKDHLYPKAKRAFSDRHYEYSEYYKRIRPFLAAQQTEALCPERDRQKSFCTEGEAEQAPAQGIWIACLLILAGDGAGHGAFVCWLWDGTQDWPAKDSALLVPPALAKVKQKQAGAMWSGGLPSPGAAQGWFHRGCATAIRRQRSQGGAPGEDLRALSKNDVNMDIQTFLGLKGSSLKELTPENVKGLLGTNLNDLRDNQNVSLVREWIQKQKQSDLNSLGLGLQGGLPEGFIILKSKTTHASALRLIA
ncbi:hypothetical protein L345_16747, partial [Ophiophagus hannah]